MTDVQEQTSGKNQWIEDSMLQEATTCEEGEDIWQEQTKSDGKVKLSLCLTN
jgi:hypothetical protein